MPRLTDAAAHKKKPNPDKRIELHDGNGLYLVIQPSGAKSWAYRYRVDGKSRKLTLGTLLNPGAKPAADASGDLPAISVTEARQKASAASVKVQRGADPIEERKRKESRAKNSVNSVLDTFVARHAKNLRSGDQVERAFDVYVRPRIGGKSIYDLKRRDVVEMLDEIEDENGPVMADRVLACVRKAFNWQATRDDQFSPPIVKGMARTKPKERSRKRILDDDEIRDVWAALDKFEGADCYPAYVKTLLLTATRRNESSDMHSDEIVGDLWTIPGARYKTKLDHVIPLTDMARQCIGNRSGFIFSTTNGEIAFSGFSKAKAELDRLTAEARKKAGRPAMPRWTLHDLRRTGRSLMSRAKVATDHAERALGHVMGGVRETYDRYEYLEEKRAAFKALEGLVRMILTPAADNVTHLHMGRA
jgi:integrase